MKLNPSVKAKNLAKAFDVDHRIRIENFLEAKDAEALHAAIAACQNFRFTYNDGDEEVFVRPMELKNMPERRLREFGNKIFNRAMQGDFQYTCYACPLSAEAIQENPALENFTDLWTFLDSKAFKTLIKDITGIEGAGFSAEVRWHKTDSFQTTGDGSRKGENRLLGFVLDLTKDWNADWGGNRLYQDKAGNITDIEVPAFNSLSLFKVPTAHSKSYVTGYAKGLNLTIEGWILGK